MTTITNMLDSLNLLMATNLLSDKELENFDKIGTGLILVVLLRIVFEFITKILERRDTEKITKKATSSPPFNTMAMNITELEKRTQTMSDTLEKISNSINDMKDSEKEFYKWKFPALLEKTEKLINLIDKE